MSSTVIERMAAKARAVHTKQNLGMSVEWEALSEPYRDEWRVIAQAAAEVLLREMIQNAEAFDGDESNTDSACFFIKAFASQHSLNIKEEDR